MDDLEFHRICQALEIAPATVRNRARLENGPVWQVLELSDADAVLAAESSRLRWPEFQAVGLIGAHGSGHECDYEVRMLAPSSGMSEDPITGSLNSALSHWLHGMGRLGQDLLVAQGTSIGRQGRVYMRPDRENSGTVRIGGETQMLIEGTVIL